MSSEKIGAKGQSLRLKNNEYFVCRSADGVSDIPVFKVNASDEIEIVGTPPFQELSVNNAQHYIDAQGKLNFYTYVRTNQAGNFNGGGTGNKMICGLKGYNNGSEGVPLVDFPAIEIEATIMQPAVVVATSHQAIQGLAVFDVLRIVNFDSTLNALPSGSNVPFGNPAMGDYSLKRTLISGNTYKYEMNPDTSACYIVVQGLAVNVIAGAIEGVHYVVQAGAPATNASSYWTFVTYSVAAVQLLYPDAKIFDTVTTDGGAPKSKLMTGVYFSLGDSSTSTYGAIKVNYMKVNGETII